MVELGGTTGTGLDRLVEAILNDDGLAARIPESEIEAGARSADLMNTIIVEGIRTLGLANDGELTAGDVRDLSDWIAENHYETFFAAHGDDEDGEETGFHLVQNDGAATYMFGRNAVNSVADGIFHLAFGYEKGRIINEDGNRNAALDDMAYWLNELLEDDLAEAEQGNGLLASQTDPKAVTRSGSGLDQLVDMILDDPRLNERLPTSEIREAAQAAADINTMIRDIIVEKGLANDGKITASDVLEINSAIRSDPDLYARFVALHGDDESDGTETGFHLVQNDGAHSRLFGQNGVNTVADGIFHIGFEVKNGRFLNEDGNNNQRVETVASWINNLLEDDFEAGTLVNENVDPLPGGATGTGLDRLVEIIESDVRLEGRIPTSEIAEGAKAANTINQLILDGIKATGAANDGKIDAADIRDINAWIRADEARYQAFVEAHGDDEDDGTETGFHLVQNDGASSRLYGENAVNTIADGIFHIGFEIQNNRFLNEDGNGNQSVEDVAAWINELLSPADIASLVNEDVEAYVEGSTGTGLDKLIDILNDDPGLEYRIAASEIAAGAKAADNLNKLILEGISAVGAAQDGVITTDDVEAVNAWIRADETRLQQFIEFHGDDENDGTETGFHLVQNDGARTGLYGRNAVNNIMDSIYHIGFEVDNGRFLNEDGNRNASLDDVAKWLNDLLSDDLATGNLGNPVNGPADPADVDVAALQAHVVYEGPDVTVDANGAGYEIVEHNTALELAEGTLTFNFTANDSSSYRDVLFSKDGSGYQDGGHTTIWVSRGHLYARFQTDQESTYLKAYHVVEEGKEYNLAFTFDGDNAFLYLDGKLLDVESSDATWEGNDEEMAIGANIWARDERWRQDWVDDELNGSVTDLKILDVALNQAEVQAFTGHVPEAAFEMPVGTTGTGLDQMIAIITKDVGLAARVDPEEIAAGARAVDGMNQIIVEALRETGLANDGTITAADIRTLSDWIAANKSAEFTALHGDDEGDEETGFHLIQNDGAQTRIFGDNAVNTVFDGIYHLVFGYNGSRIINEDGNNNQTLEDLAWWLESLLEVDLKEAGEGTGALYNGAVDAYAVEKTGTGFDQIMETILNDGGLTKNVSTADQVEGANAAAGIAKMILAAIAELGLANDGEVTASDVYAINEWIRSDADRLAEFVALHGDDEDGEETGFHLVQNDGAEARLFGADAVNTIFDGIFHIGFETDRGRFLNEDGNGNASVESVAYWINQLLIDDLQAGKLDNGAPEFEGTTGTGLDDLVDIIMDDEGLETRISEMDIRGGAEAANALNGMIKEGIIATGIAQNGEITASDVYALNEWFRADAARYQKFVELHGDDEGDGTETGFHLVQNDGSYSRLFGDSAINTVADGLFHIGFEIKYGRLLNEDGNYNASVKTVAGWLDSLLSDEDLAAMAQASTDNPYIYGSTGTGLDTLVDIITDDDNLVNRISTMEIRGGAEAAQGLNEIILDKIIETGVANDGEISTYDVYQINAAIRSDADTYARFVELHGDDESDGTETGFHLVQNDGAVTELYGRNAVNTVADGIYHIGFEIRNGRLLNEDGNSNACVSTVAEWLDDLLANDLAAGSLINESLLAENIDLAGLKAKEVFSLGDVLDVNKKDGHQEFADSDALDLSEGTVVVGFTADNPDGWDKDTLFSRDASGYGNGGHLTMYVQNNDLVARFQSTEKSIYLKAKDVIEAGTHHEAAFSFNGEKVVLYLDGQIVDAELFDQTWEGTDEDMTVGASLMYRQEGSDYVNDRFEGEIDDLMIFNEELNFAEIQAAALDDYALV